MLGIALELTSGVVCVEWLEVHGGLPVAEDGAAYVRTSAEQGYILTPRALLLGVPVQAQGPGPLVLHRPELASTIHIVTSKYWQLEVSVSSISCWAATRTSGRIASLVLQA